MAAYQAAAKEQEKQTLEIINSSIAPEWLTANAPARNIVLDIIATQCLGRIAFDPGDVAENAVADAAYYTRQIVPRVMKNAPFTKEEFCAKSPSLPGRLARVANTVAVIATYGPMASWLAKAASKSNSVQGTMFNYRNGPRVLFTLPSGDAADSVTRGFELVYLPMQDVNGSSWHIRKGFQDSALSVTLETLQTWALDERQVKLGGSQSEDFQIFNYPKEPPQLSIPVATLVSLITAADPLFWQSVGFGTMTNERFAKDVMSGKGVEGVLKQYGISNSYYMRRLVYRLWHQGLYPVSRWEALLHELMHVAGLSTAFMSGKKGDDDAELVGKLNLAVTGARNYFSTSEGRALIPAGVAETLPYVFQERVGHEGTGRFPGIAPAGWTLVGPAVSSTLLPDGGGGMTEILKMCKEIQNPKKASNP